MMILHQPTHFVVIEPLGSPTTRFFLRWSWAAQPQKNRAVLFSAEIGKF